MTFRALRCYWLGHRWTRWKGYRALRHPVPGQVVEIPAAALIATVQGVYIVQGKVYCSRCLTLPPRRP